jgi:hypothetical protein
MGHTIWTDTPPEGEKEKAVGKGRITSNRFILTALYAVAGLSCHAGAREGRFFVTHGTLRLLSVGAFSRRATFQQLLALQT